jgi:hypothetical protein
MPLLDRPAALDLVLAERGKPDRCLRVALTGHERKLAWTGARGASIGGAWREQFPIDNVDGFGGGTAIEARFGGYAGPIRVFGELGTGWAYCMRDCSDRDLGYWFVPLGLSAHWFALETEGLGVDLGLAYHFVGGLQGDRWTVLHAEVRGRREMRGRRTPDPSRPRRHAAAPPTPGASPRARQWRPWCHKRPRR